MYCSNSYLGYSGYKCILLIATIFVLHKQFILNNSFLTKIIFKFVIYQQSFLLFFLKECIKTT